MNVSASAVTFAVVLLVTQGEGAVPKAVDTPDLHVRPTVAQVVLGCQLLANEPVNIATTAAPKDGSDLKERPTR